MAGQLAALGFYPGGDPLPGQADNPKGFFEPRAVVALHDEILRSLGSTWDDPRPLPENWLDAAVLVPYRERLKTLISFEFGSVNNWFVKDPRLCRLLPLWLAVLGELGVPTKVLIVVRQPAEVLASLIERSKTDPEQAATLWLAHYAEAEIASRGLSRAVVLYEDWLADWRGEAMRIFASLGIDVPQFGEDFVEPGLQHQRDIALPAFNAPQNGWTAGFFQALVTWRRDGISPSETADAVAEDLILAARAALPAVAYMREADARAHAAEIRVLQAGGGAPVGDIFTRHFKAEQERATAKAQLLAHERLMLIKQMQISASWRITRPLRGLRRLLRG